MRYELSDDQVKRLLSNRISVMKPVIADIARQYLTKLLKKTVNSLDLEVRKD